MEKSLMETLVIVDKSVDFYVDKAFELFNINSVICISGTMIRSRKIKHVVEKLEQKDCKILDRFSDSNYRMCYMSNPKN